MKRFCYRTVIAIVFAVVAVLNTSALGAGLTCSQVRTMIATYGAPAVLTYARQHGYSEKQIRAIRKKCKV